jgi:hypothetical protein
MAAAAARAGPGRSVWPPGRPRDWRAVRGPDSQARRMEIRRISADFPAAIPLPGLGPASPLARLVAGHERRVGDHDSIAVSGCDVPAQPITCSTPRVQPASRTRPSPSIPVTPVSSASRPPWPSRQARSTPVNRVSAPRDVLPRHLPDRYTGVPAVATSTSKTISVRSTSAVAGSGHQCRAHRLVAARLGRAVHQDRPAERADLPHESFC